MPPITWIILKISGSERYGSAAAGLQTCLPTIAGFFGYGTALNLVTETIRDPGERP